MISRTNDGRLLFLLNNIAKMKTRTPLVSRIAEAHKSSRGNAGSGENNAICYIVENDLLEAVIAVPENMSYNIKIGTLICILSNNKEQCRKGKIQLIGVTVMSGGSGTIIGTIVGAFVIGVINDGMTMCGVSEFWQKIIRGAVIILALIIDQTQRNLQAKIALRARNESK